MARRKLRSAALPTGRPTVNVNESPLTWLRSRRGKDGETLITDAEFAAGERLRADFTFGQLQPRVTANWDALANGTGRRSHPASDPDLKDEAYAARERVHRALAAAGPGLSAILLDVCCHLVGIESAEKRAGWPRRSGKLVLKIALGHLALHYGLARPAPADGPVRVRHWASPGYRPAIGDDLQ